MQRLAADSCRLFLVWHLAFHHIPRSVVSEWFSCLALISVNIICICYERGSVLHRSLHLLSVSSMPSWECQVLTFSPAWHSLVGLHKVFLPLLWLFRVSPSPGCQPVSSSVCIVFDMPYQSCFKRWTPHWRSFSGLFPGILVFKARIFIRPFHAGRFSINQFSLASSILCPQGVSPSILIIISSLWWIITSLSAVVFLEVSLQLFMMDNNVLVCGDVLLSTFDFLSLIPCCA